MIGDSYYRALVANKIKFDNVVGGVIQTLLLTVLDSLRCYDSEMVKLGVEDDSESSVQFNFFLTKLLAGCSELVFYFVLVIKVRLVFLLKPIFFIENFVSNLSLDNMVYNFFFFFVIYRRIRIVRGLMEGGVDVCKFFKNRYLFFRLFFFQLVRFIHEKLFFLRESCFAMKFNDSDQCLMSQGVWFEWLRLAKLSSYHKYSFNMVSKSKAVAQYLIEFYLTFKNRNKRQRRRRRKFEPGDFPWRISPFVETFFTRNRPESKLFSYNDYRRLKFFFGNFKPSEFWHRSRFAKRGIQSGDFVSMYSYLDLKLDYLLTRLNFTEHIFLARRFINSKVVVVSNRIITGNNAVIKPFDWIGVLSKLRFKFKLNFCTRLAMQRTQFYFLRKFPSFVEPNWGLFHFFILPFVTNKEIIRPFKTWNLHVGGGRVQPAKLG